MEIDWGRSRRIGSRYESSLLPATGLYFLPWHVQRVSPPLLADCLLPLSAHVVSDFIDVNHYFTLHISASSIIHQQGSCTVYE